MHCINLSAEKFDIFGQYNMISQEIGTYHWLYQLWIKVREMKFVNQFHDTSYGLTFNSNESSKSAKENFACNFLKFLVIDQGLTILLRIW